MIDLAYSEEAEKAVLSCMLVKPEEAIDEVIEHLTDSHFFVQAHAQIFISITNLYTAKQRVDIITVAQHLTDREMLNQVGGNGYLAEIGALMASGYLLRQYVDIVKDKYLLRALSAVSAQIKAIADQHADDALQAIDESEKAVLSIREKNLGERTAHWCEVVTDEHDRLQSIIKRERVGTGLATSFKRLDGLTGGFRGGEMIVVAARPGMGKTGLLLSWIDAMTNKKAVPSGLLSLEMGKSQIFDRLLSMSSGLSLASIRTGNLALHHSEIVGKYSSHMRDWPFAMDDRSNLNLMSMRALARRWKRNMGLQILFIDYLQLLHGIAKNGRQSNRQEEVAEISRGIKALAKDLDIPIVVAAQLNRNASEGHVRPKLHNLRESGSIEQDADIVLLLHRETDMEEGTPTGDYLDYSLTIAKQRNGPIDLIPLNFKCNLARFEEK